MKKHPSCINLSAFRCLIKVIFIFSEKIPLSQKLLQRDTFHTVWYCQQFSTVHALPIKFLCWPLFWVITSSVRASQDQRLLHITIDFRALIIIKISQSLYWWTHYTGSTVNFGVFEIDILVRVTLLWNVYCNQISLLL